MHRKCNAYMMCPMSEWTQQVAQRKEKTRFLSYLGYSTSTTLCYSILYIHLVCLIRPLSSATPLQLLHTLRACVIGVLYRRGFLLGSH